MPHTTRDVLDGEAVLAHVRQGTAPTSWRVLHGRRQYFLENTLSFGFWTIFCFSVMLLIGYFALVSATNSNDSPLGYALLELLGIVVLGFCGFQTIDNFRQIATADKQLMILTPNGFVVAQKPDAPLTRSVSYSQVLSIGTRQWQTGGRRGIVQFHFALVFHLRNASVSEWEMDHRFGDYVGIADAIILEHADYIEAHLR